MAKFFGKKGGAGGGTRNSGAGTNKALIWLAWLLATCGFGILLGGVASMQQACGSSANLISAGTGTVGYLGPVSCDHFFQYTWWITFLHFFAWLMVLVYLAGGLLHKTRTALVGLLAVASVLLMDTTNTYMLLNYLPGNTGSMPARIRATIAGAMVSAIADVLLMLLIGWFAEYEREERRGETTTAYGTGATTTTAPAYGAATTTPAYTTGHTTTTTTAGTVPVSTTV